MLIVSKQKFNGSWDLSEIAHLLDISLEVLKKANPSLDKDVWGTAIGVAFLEVVLVKSKSTWKMVANKARGFMTKELLKGGTDAKDVSEKVQTIIDNAMAFITANFK